MLDNYLLIQSFFGDNIASFFGDNIAFKVILFMKFKFILKYLNVIP